MTSHELAVQFGYLVALFGVGAVGSVCLITGLRARKRARQRRTGISATPLIIIGVVLLNVGGLGLAGSLVTAYYPSPFDTDKSMRVGQCVDQTTFFATRFGSNPENSCANPANTYELAFRGAPSASCPDGKRDRSIYDRYTDNYTIMCFALNLKQGRCYQLANGAEALTMTLGDCSKPQPMQTRVVQRIDGSTDTTRCRPGDRSIAYPAPPRVYCLAPTGA
ncbi:hypothetical protein [Mycobacterium interjectum]|uniref:hypothetical protein n=1 Tax=Mycobacterium interjectum TaxID=33895 RepID=UPI00082DB860|nr:hypothetical protein [Mycobacterium interjectum]MCV7091869.1 hypothetical protein [Mycobacterium interjectum]